MMLLELKTGAPAKWHNCQVAAYAYLVKQNWLSESTIFRPLPEFRRIDTNDGHEYQRFGKKVLSVSEVCVELNPWNCKDETAMKVGKFIHDFCEIIDYGNENKLFAMLSEAAEKYPAYHIREKIQAYKKFKVDYQLEDKKIINEIPLYSSLGYAGTFDKFIPGPSELQVKILYLKETGDYSITNLNAGEVDRYFNIFCHSLEMLKHKKVVDEFKESK